MMIFERRANHPLLSSPLLQTLTSTLRTSRASTNVKMKIAIVFRGEEEGHRHLGARSKAQSGRWREGTSSNKTRWCSVTIRRKSRSIAPNFCNFRLMANIRIVTKKEALKRLLVLAINDEISFPPRFSSFVCSLFRTERLEVEVYEV